MNGPAVFSILVTLAAYPGVVFSTRSSVLLCSFSVLVVVSAVQVLYLGLAGEYWAHVAPGAVLGRAAMQALRGDGGPLQVIWWQGALGGGGFLLLTFSEMYTTHLTRLGHLSHIMIYLASGSIAAGAALDSKLDGGGARRRTATLDISLADAAPLRWITAARVHHDSACLLGIGLVLAAHRHDPQEIAVHFHSTQAMLMMCLAVAQLGGWLLLQAFPRPAVLTSVRLLQCGAWMLNSVWLLLMAALLYLLPGRRGLHHLMWREMPDAAEANATYLALALWLTVVLVLVADRSGSARQRPPPHKRNVNYKQATVDTAVDGADALEEVRLFS